MAAKDDTKQAKSGGIMPLVIALAVAAVAGLGAGFGAVTFLGPASGPPRAVAPSGSLTASTVSPDGKLPEPGEKHAAEAEEAGSGEADHVEEVIGPADLDFTPLPPVIVNLAEPREVWIRLESGIAFSKASEKKPELLAAEAAQQIAQYLKTVRLQSIEGPDGMQFLQDDINAMVKALSGGEVQEVLISGLIVE